MVNNFINVVKERPKEVAYLSLSVFPIVVIESTHMSCICLIFKQSVIPVCIHCIRAISCKDPHVQFIPAVTIQIEKVKFQLTRPPHLKMAEEY